MRVMVKLLTVAAFVFYLLVSWVSVDAQDDLSRRVLDLERTRADARLVSLEMRLDTIEKIEIKTRLEQLERVGNGLLILVFGQLVLNGLNLRRR